MKLTSTLTARRTFLAGLALAAHGCGGSSAPPQSQNGAEPTRGPVKVEQAGATPLQLTPYYADANSFHVASVLVSGERDAVLVDAQFTLADAGRVVEMVRATNKRLTTVYVSHGDPDYYFGTEVVRAAFPEARVVATPSTIAHIQKTLKKKLEVWGPRLGSNGPANVVLPDAQTSPIIQLEDHALEIVGFDGENAERTYVWIPGAEAVVGGVAVYGNLHLWTADAASVEKRRAWDRVLQSMEVRQPRRVFPGHSGPAAPLDASAIRFSREYLEVYEAELARASHSAQLIAAMTQRFPAAGLPMALEIGAKVNKGEMVW